MTLVYQVRPPSEIITNFDAIREWLIFIGIIIAVGVGAATLVGILYAGFKRWKKRRKENDG